MSAGTNNRLDGAKLEKVIEIAHKLNLKYALIHNPEDVTAVYYLHKTDLGQYVELCRRLENAGLKVQEEFVDEPMDSPETRPIGEVRVKIPILREKR
jgi:hypothetical protein